MFGSKGDQGKYIEAIAMLVLELAETKRALLEATQTAEMWKSIAEFEKKKEVSCNG